MNTDKEFLKWIHARLEHVYGESPNVDYMWRLRAIIHAIPERQMALHILIDKPALELE